MADKHIANAEASWKALCTAPDWCKVGNSVVPFDSFRDLSKDLVASPNVHARGTPVYRLSDWVSGTDSNAGSGVISQSSRAAGHVKMAGDTTTVNVNGLICARHDTLVWMNYGPGGPNTVGRLQTETGGPQGSARNGKLPCNDPPKSSPKLEKLQELKEATKSIDPNRLDEFVRFADANQTLDQWIAQIDMVDRGGWSRVGNWLAQGTRAVSGFGKDIVMGLGEMAYTLAKAGTPGGAFHSSLDTQMLVEQIRLGNICLESVKQAARAAGKQLAKPVTDAWEHGNYVEAVGRGGLEIGSLLLMVGDLAKLAQASKVAKAAEAEKAAEAARAAQSVGAIETAKAAEAADAATAQRSSEAQQAAAQGNGTRIRELTNHEKAAFGERTAHGKMVEKGYEPLGKTDGNYKPGQQGIDGVYKNPSPPPDYVITEVKYGSGQLEKDLADGTDQMDNKWVKDRLVDKVGRADAEDVIDAMDSGRVEKWLIRVDKDGLSSATKIGPTGSPIRGDLGKVVGF